MRRILMVVLSLFVIAGVWIAFDPSVIGKVFGRFVDGKINGDQLISILKTTPIRYAVTSHSQNYVVETRWGFWYGGIWNPAEVTQDYDIKKAEDNRFDILNVICAYSDHLGYTPLICCE